MSELRKVPGTAFYESGPPLPGDEMMARDATVRTVTLKGVAYVEDDVLKAVRNYASLKRALDQMLAAFELGCSLHHVTIEELRAADNAWFALKKAEQK